MRRKRGHTLEGLHVALEGGTTRFVSLASPLILHLTCLISMFLRRLASSASLELLLDLIKLVLELLHIYLKGSKTLLKEKRKWRGGVAPLGLAGSAERGAG